VTNRNPNYNINLLLIAFPPTKCCKRSSYCYTLNTQPRTLPSSDIHVSLFTFLCFLIWKMNFFHMTPSPELPNSMQPVGWFELGVCEWPTLPSPKSEKFIFPCWCWRWFFLSIIIAFKSSSSFCNSPSTLSCCSTALIKSTILVPLLWHPYTSNPSLTKGLVSSSTEAATSATTWNNSQQTSINTDDTFRKKIKQQNTQLTVLFVKLLLITLKRLSQHTWLQKMQHNSSLGCTQVIINKSYNFNPLGFETTSKR